MDIVLTDIETRLTDKVPALQYIDEDWGQLDDYSPNYPVKWPCALVDAINVNYDNLGNKVQMGLCTIRVIIADVKLTNSNTKAPDGQRQKALSFHTLVKEVYKALHGFTGHSHYSGLVRTSLKRLPRNDGVRAHEMLFTVQVKDVLAKKQKITIAAEGLGLEINTQTNLSSGGIGMEILEEQFTVS